MTDTLEGLLQQAAERIVWRLNGAREAIDRHDERISTTISRLIRLEETVTALDEGTSSLFGTRLKERRTTEARLDALEAGGRVPA